MILLSQVISEFEEDLLNDYAQLFKLAWETLRSFGLNDKKLHGKMGATGVLHTHTRSLDYHPHVHFIIPFR